jgi:hypothetical protein
MKKIAVIFCILILNQSCLQNDSEIKKNNSAMESTTKKAVLE